MAPEPTSTPSEGKPTSPPVPSEVATGFTHSQPQVNKAVTDYVAVRPIRFKSLDVFRGLTVAGMILANNPGSWSAMYPPLKHASWHGWTPTDLIFPFFLFAVGNALAFVMTRMASASTQEVLFKILKRTLLIFAIGIFLQMFPFVRWNSDGLMELKTYETMRILGVLQRIALSFGGAALIIWCIGKLVGSALQERYVIITSGFFLVAYWLSCRLLGAPADPYSLEGFIGTKVDRYLLTPNHLYRGEGVPFDPEGLFSTITTIAQVMIGWWVGKLMMRSNKDMALVGTLSLVGIHLIFLAYVWQFEFPLNKKIWSSSFILHTSGLGMLVLAFIVFWLDVPAKKAQNFPKLDAGFRAIASAIFRFFEVFGKNPLFIFVLSGMVVKGLSLVRWKPDGSQSFTSPLPWVYQNFFKWDGVDPRLGSVTYSLCLLTIYWVVVAWMDCRKIYVKV